MFKKLQQQNITNKNIQRTKSKSKSVTPSKRINTYSGISRKKLNNSQFYDYEIANLGDHLFQGCFNKNKKHGEGVMILNSGVVVIGNWHNGKLNGYALFVTPFGGKVHTNYLAGFLEGWVILQYGNSFQIVKFSQDKDQLIRRRYDQSQQLWTQALYNSNGRLQKVLKIQKTKDFNLPTFIVDQKLIQFYNHIIMKGETNLNINKIRTIKINSSFQYYGYVNMSETPSGLGVIFSSNELYAGNFKGGSLDEEGLILFQNGLIYRGELYSGKIWGNGAIYDINLDQTKFVKVCQEGIQYVLQLVEGYKINSVPFKMGKVCNVASDKGFSMVIDELCEQVTKYYFRSNSAFNSEQYDEQSLQSSMANSQANAKQASFQDKQSKISESEQHEYNSRKYAQKQAQRLALFTQKNKNSNNTKYGISDDQKLKKNTLQTKEKQNINEDSLEFQIQEVKPLPNNISHSIPSLTPSFEQISKGITKKVLYPHLLQFQISKNILSPCKFSKIGKIVNNSNKITQTLS